MGSPARSNGGFRPPRRLTHGGETLTVSEWARRIGITQQALSLRLQRMRVAEALTMERCSASQAAARAAQARRERYQVAALSRAETEALDQLLAERRRLRARLKHLTDMRLAEKFELAVGTVRARDKRIAE